MTPTDPTRPIDPPPEPSSPYAGTTPVASLIEGGGPVTLVEGRTFALSDRAGDAVGLLPQGLFEDDLRILSTWVLRVDGETLEPLAVHLDEPYAATHVGRPTTVEAGKADSDIVVFRHREIGRGMRERIVVTNHGLEPAHLSVDLAAEVDFASVFAVKERRATGRPVIPEAEGDCVRHRQPVEPGRVVSVEAAGAQTDAGRLSWTIELGPGASWEGEVDVCVFSEGAGPDGAEHAGAERARAERGRVSADRMSRWRSTVPQVESDDVHLTAAIARSSEDLGALRIFDPELELPVVAAGAPWFMTLFGRDSLLTSWMSLIADHTLAQGVLEALARFQGRDVDDRSEEQPGKILHEVRSVSAGGPSIVHHDIYYGTVDVTPLFVMLLGELRRWDPRNELVDRLLPHADRALDWIATFGDVDGDGYVEYERRNPAGLANQGWKDSWDAVRHADGRLAEGPIALAEVQGYVYAAYIARAHLAREAGDAATVRHYADLARELRQRFNEDFWVDELGTFALALDGDKAPVAVATSNPGHCLWTGIVQPERAGSVAAELLSPGMFSGWGVRTLSTAARAYNPVSYHNGSVWPHDNAIVAAGLSRYGLVEHAHRVITAQLEVAAAHRGQLPELFAGFDRGTLPVPASYPTSCSPQAWAAAAPLLWLRTLLRIDPWAPRQKVWLTPALPEGIRRLTATGINIGGRRVSVQVEGEAMEVDGLGDLELLTTPRRPLTELLDDG